MTLIPYKHRILAKLIVENTTASGLIIPDTAKKKHDKAQVVASHSKEFSPGDIVFFDRYAEKEITHDGETYILLHEDHILAFINSNRG